MGWFFPDETAARPARHDDRGVYVALCKAPTAHTVSVRLRLGREALERTGWAEGQRLRLAWSNGPDVGRVMAVPSDDKGPALRFNGKARNFLSTKFGNVLTPELAARNDASWALVDESRPLTKVVEWAWYSEGLVVTLPRAWWVGLEAPAAGEPSPQEERAAAPEKLERTAPPVAAKAARAPRPASAIGPSGGTTAKARPAVPATAAPLDQVAYAHQLLDQELYDSEIINKLRCTSAFLDDRKRERSLRSATAGAPPP